MPDASSAPRILVVEDEALIAVELQERLHALGFATVGPVDTADAAVAMAEHAQPALVLMDIRLKGAGDGIDAAREIQNRFGIPVVFVTANADRSTYERALSTEHFGFVVKPFLERDLRIVLDTALARAASAHRLSQALADVHALNEMIFAAAPVAMAVVDREGRLHHSNARMRELLGLATRPVDRVEDTPQVAKADALERAPAVAAALWSRLEASSQRTVAQEFVWRVPSGRPQQMLGTAVRLPDHAGQIPMMLLCCHVIDQRKRLIVDQLTREAESDDDTLPATLSSLPRRVLLVEDDASIRGVLGRLLRREGILVTDAVDGMHAWSVLGAGQTPADSHTPPFDVLLTDIVMPNLDGASLAQRVRTQYPTLPVLFMSGFYDEARLEGMAGTAAPPLLRKPFRQAELLQALAEVHVS